VTGQTEEPLQEGKSIDLYPLPEGWKWGTVSDAGAHQRNAIVDGPFGSNLKVSDYVEGGPVPVLTTKNLEGKYYDVRYITKEKFEELKRSAVYPGDILMAKIGSCGKTGIYPPNNPPAMIPANLLKVSLNDQFELKYVYYYFNSSFFQKALRTITKATAQPAFGVTNFRKLPLPYTTRDQQKRIVAEIEKQFSRLDESVANLKRVKANLKRYKASVLKAAVEGKLTEDWRKKHPNVEPASKLLERILAERRAKWSGKGKYKELVSAGTSKLPALPERWVWCITDALFSYVTSGSRGWAQHYSVEGPIFLRIGNLDHDSIRLDLRDIQRVKPPEGTEGTRTKVEEGDILVSITADVGMIAVAPPSLEEAYINQHVALARPVRGICREYLAWYLAARDGGQNEFRRLQRGATKAGLGLDDIRAVPVPLPPLAEQQKIVAEVERRLSIIDELEAAVETNLTRTDRLRQSILSQAFSGRLVGEGSKHVQDIPPTFSIAAESQAKYIKDNHAGR
jgi:type I restriction enzyme S subunit